LSLRPNIDPGIPTMMGHIGVIPPFPRPRRWGPLVVHTLVLMRYIVSVNVTVKLLILYRPIDR